MCALNPYQRGGIVNGTELNSNGTTQCGNVNVIANGSSNGIEPCYGQYNDDERITNFIGRNANQPMMVYKNLDHYNGSNPGNFTWNLYSYNTATDVYTFVKYLGSQYDTDTKGAHASYQITATIPDNLEGEHYVIQTIYYTNTHIWNTSDIVNFYQCADALLV